FLPGDAPKAEDDAHGDFLLPAAFRLQKVISLGRAHIGRKRNAIHQPLAPQAVRDNPHGCAGRPPQSTSSPAERACEKAPALWPFRLSYSQVVALYALASQTLNHPRS